MKITIVQVNNLAYIAEDMSPFINRHCVIEDYNATVALLFRRGYIYGAVTGHRDAMFTAVIRSLDGAKPVHMKMRGRHFSKLYR